VDAEFLAYVWRFTGRSWPRLEAALTALPAGVSVVRLRTPRDVRRFLATL